VHLAPVDRSDPGQAQTGGSHRAGQALDRRQLEPFQLSETVLRRDRDDGRHAPTGSDERGDAVGNPVVATQDTPEQRSPREQDADLVGEIEQLDRGRLGRRDHEQQVGPPATIDTARGAAGRLGHRHRVGVDGDDECSRFGFGERQRGAAVTRSEIDDRPFVAGDQSGDLPDVDLDEAASDDCTHRVSLRDTAS
jgi:hypothetical protein